MHPENELLMTPGPVPVLPRVLRAMSKPMIHHRGTDFADLLAKIQDDLRYVFQTRNDIFILTGSGTSAMEASICNVINGDEVVVIVNGVFGKRYKHIAERYGKVVSVDYEWGTPINLEEVDEALEKGAKAVVLVHNETSTGMLNPGKEIGKLAKKHDALFIVDAISSMGGDDIPVDKWGIDIAVTATQKCLSAPPGLSVISVSERAYESMDGIPPHYLDIRTYRKHSEKGQTPYTPAIPIFFALKESLEAIREETIEKRIERHRKLSKSIRNGLEALGLEIFPKTNGICKYSNTITAVNNPKGISYDELDKGMRSHGIILTGGQAHLSDKIFRIATMGNTEMSDVLRTIQALELVLRDYGLIKELGRGTEAALR